jgi:hypothetical protein
MLASFLSGNPTTSERSKPGFGKIGGRCRQIALTSYIPWEVINPVAGKGRNRMNTSILNTRGDAGRTAKCATRQMDFEMERRDDVCIVRIRGRLATGANTDYLRMKAQAIKSLGCGKLIADISELDSIG